MTSPVSVADGSAALARREAQSILAEPRFHADPVPRPLHGVLHAIGQVLEAPLNAVEELVSRLGSLTPGGVVSVWGMLAALVLVGCGVLASTRARRSLAEPGVGAIDVPMQPPLSARDLEREAVAAEGLGHHADAVRLRFRAGLMRLAERDRGHISTTMPNAEVARALRSERFDVLASRFDEIAYGGREARPEDVEVARREWQRLLSSRRSA
jgi:hypothetical protein